MAELDLEEDGFIHHLQSIHELMVEAAQDGQAPGQLDLSSEGTIGVFRELHSELRGIDIRDLSRRYTAIAQSKFAINLTLHRKDTQTNGLAEALYRSCQRTLPKGASSEFGELVHRLVEMTITQEEHQSFVRANLICPIEVSRALAAEQRALGIRMVQELKLCPEEIWELAQDLQSTARTLTRQHMEDLATRQLF